MGTSLRLERVPLKIPGGSNVLRLLEEIRKANGFRHGIYKITVNTMESGKPVRRSIDLRRMTLKEAELKTFPGGTTIAVIDGAIF